MRVRYEEAPSDELWWCNCHQRRAGWLRHRSEDEFSDTKYICDPRLGGIAAPCRTVNLTGQVEIDQ